MGDMAAEIDLAVIDEVSGLEVPLMYAFVRDNGGTLEMHGDLDPCDLVYSANVGGTGRPGFNIIGHNANIGEDPCVVQPGEPEEPYLFPFMVDAEIMDDDGQNYLVGCRFTVGGNIGQVPVDTVCCDQPAGDLNDDCCVDLRDYAIFAQEWMDCGSLMPPGDCFGGDPALEACCQANGTCSQMSPDICAESGGTPMGIGSDCETAQCPQPPEACCHADGSCTDDAPQNCDGTPQGPGTDCVTAQCPPPDEWCCLPTGGCVMMPANDCDSQGGVSVADCVECPGSDEWCCLPTGGCAMIPANDCDTQGGIPVADCVECGGPI